MWNAFSGNRSVVRIRLHSGKVTALLLADHAADPGLADPSLLRNQVENKYRNTRLKRQQSHPDRHKVASSLRFFGRPRL